MTTVGLAMHEWEEGYRQVQALRNEPRRYSAVARVVEQIGDELRRRLGSAFTLAELAALYAEGTEWALAVATMAGADDPLALDARCADAAFYLYSREAADYPPRRG